MRIRLNGAWRDLHEAAPASAHGLSPSLAAVLEQLGYGHLQVATAVNGEFVPACSRAAVWVREGDRIEVLAPMQGG